MNFKETRITVESRITELEIKASYAEHMIDELNLAIFRQQQLIDRLIGEVKELREQVQTASPTEQRSLLDEIPPHY